MKQMSGFGVIVAATLSYQTLAFVCSDTRLACEVGESVDLIFQNSGYSQRIGVLIHCEAVAKQAVEIYVCVVIFQVSN